MDERIAASFAQTRGTMILLLVTAGLAAVLAAIAIYGSIWYAVSQEIPEIGIRLALGATRWSVCGVVIGRAAALSAIGTGVGIVVALAVTRGLQTLLFATQTSDPRVYAAVGGGLLVLTIAASIVPARRAMQVDPLTALRAD
jgi:ABC-type antimicrobial peptide transport system permease subunit